MCMATTAASADPSPTDPVTRFLEAKGLLPADAAAKPRLIDQVRDSASDLVLTAMNFLGVPYRRGGTDEDTGFDCSGFTRHVFENSVGLLLPRRSQDQAKADDLQPVRKDDLKPGDLVFFNTMRHAFSHVGIYIGDDKFIHSPRTGSAVRIEDMRESYWLKRYNGARRAPVLSVAGAAPSISAGTPAAEKVGTP